MVTNKLLVTGLGLLLASGVWAANIQALPNTQPTLDASGLSQPQATHDLESGSSDLNGVQLAKKSAKKRKKNRRETASTQDQQGKKKRKKRKE